jgi:hypothetical protein
MIESDFEGISANRRLASYNHRSPQQNGRVFPVESGGGNYQPRDCKRPIFLSGMSFQLCPLLRDKTTANANAGIAFAILFAPGLGLLHRAVKGISSSMKIWKEARCNRVAAKAFPCWS